MLSVVYKWGLNAGAKLWLATGVSQPYDLENCNEKKNCIVLIVSIGYIHSQTKTQ